jgi:hypothetical protein
MIDDPPQPPPAPLPRLHAVPTAPAPEPAQPPQPACIPPEGRDERGRILKGFGGRPLGARNKRSREALGAVQELAPTAIAKLALLVSQGNFAAIRYVLDVVLPKGGRTVDLDGTNDPHELISAVTNGEISPDEFARIAQGWKSALDSAELKDIKNQIEELETLVAALRK